MTSRPFYRGIDSEAPFPQVADGSEAFRYFIRQPANRCCISQAVSFRIIAAAPSMDCYENGLVRHGSCPWKWCRSRLMAVLSDMESDDISVPQRAD
uniref:Uncharacterized protein n=1 Tax=Rhizobium leguminosarum bv. viciae TaxID=387 RepID=A0A0U3I077_RHILV|nr:hypothetical protein [Rhizobium leguminosarum bv. viciae]